MGCKVVWSSANKIIKPHRNIIDRLVSRTDPNNVIIEKLAHEALRLCHIERLAVKEWGYMARRTFNEKLNDSKDMPCDKGSVCFNQVLGTDLE